MQNTIRSIVINNVPVVKEDQSIWDAANQMIRHNHGHVIITDPNSQEILVTGFFTERDLLVRVVGDKISPEETQIKEVMSSNLIQVEKDATCRHCLSAMRANRCRHLLVYDQGRYACVVSIRDVASQLNKGHGWIKLLQKVMIGFFIITVIGILGLLLSITPELINFNRHP